MDRTQISNCLSSRELNHGRRKHTKISNSSTSTLSWIVGKRSPSTTVLFLQFQQDDIAIKPRQKKGCWWERNSQIISSATLLPLLLNILSLSFSPLSLSIRFFSSLRNERDDFLHKQFGLEARGTFIRLGGGIPILPPVSFSLPLSAPTFFLFLKKFFGTEPRLERPTGSATWRMALSFSIVRLTSPTGRWAIRSRWTHSPPESCLSTKRWSDWRGHHTRVSFRSPWWLFYAVKKTVKMLFVAYIIFIQAMTPWFESDHFRLVVV